MPQQPNHTAYNSTARGLSGVYLKIRYPSRRSTQNTPFLHLLIAEPVLFDKSIILLSEPSVSRCKASMNRTLSQRLVGFKATWILTTEIGSFLHSRLQTSYVTPLPNFLQNAQSTTRAKTNGSLHRLLRKSLHSQCELVKPGSYPKHSRHFHNNTDSVQLGVSGISGMLCSESKAQTICY